MSKTDILEELPKLTSEERHEIRLKLAELDGDGWLDDDDPLTDEQKRLIESRIEAHENNRDTAIPWKEVKARLNRREFVAIGQALADAEDLAALRAAKKEEQDSPSIPLAEVVDDLGL